MFDVGFWELCLIGLISLLVIGPERLPKVARITGFWIGKTRNMIASVKQEINDELRAEEIRQLMKEQVAIDDLKQLADETVDTVNSVESTPRQKIAEEPDNRKLEKNERK